MNLAKPLVATIKGARKTQSIGSHQVESIDYDVVGIIKSKYLFKTRPKLRT